MKGKTTYLEQSLKSGYFVAWRGRFYQIEQPEAAEATPLILWLREVDTGEVKDFRIEEFLVVKGEQEAPLFAPTLAELQEMREAAEPLPPPVPEAGLPQQLLQHADKIIRAVETVQQLIQEQERLALLRGEKMSYTASLKQACAQLEEPISLTIYYEYRQRYQQHQGDRSSIAASLRRKSYHQSQMSRAQLHFIDTLILRFYAGQRTARLRPKTLYKLARSILERTGQLWLDPDKCPGNGVEYVVEELLNARLPMQAIVDNPEKASWLTPISLPSQSWFYTYLRWFKGQPDQGQQVVVARYGVETWEREYRVFDTFVHRAVRPLQYVFGDHWLVDVFSVDEATRQRLNRLWLTLLIDAGSVQTLTGEIKELKCPTKKGRRKRMIVEVKICHCPNCDSPDIIRNGTDYKGDQKYHCHQCGGYGTLTPKVRYHQEQKVQVLKAYQERVSMRGIRRIFGVVPQTLLRWIKAALEKLPSLLQTLAPARSDDVLELDELWSFVLKKSNKRWIWIALCRRTRQVIAYYIGDRSEESCRQLWQRLPTAYKGCTSYSDFWAAYQKVWPQETHQAVGKDTGQTAHVERWNNTLRQRLARFVRKTLSFSKSDLVHELVLRFFIINYNLQCSTSQ